MSNPKMLSKLIYMGFCVFGTFHLTRISIALMASKLVGRFGKPQLVRETSKIYSNNYLTLPFVYTQKFLRQNVMKHTEANMLKGVILDK
jgi:hypothetical protein